MKSAPKAIWIVIGVVLLVAGLWVISTGMLGLIKTMNAGAKNALLEYGTYILILISGVGVVVKAVGILLSIRRKS